MQHPVIGVRVQVEMHPSAEWRGGGVLDIRMADGLMLFLVKLDGAPPPNPDNPDDWIAASRVRVAIGR
jgi:hypothetical protein